MYIIHSSGRGLSIYVRCEEFSEDWLSIKDEMMAKAVVTNFKESIDKKSIFDTEFKISPPLTFALSWRRLD